MNEASQTKPFREAYDRLDRQFIGGRWRNGRAKDSMADLDPYTGNKILSIALANKDNLDEAFTAASKAQRDWDATLPGEKAAVFRRAATIMEERRQEIVSWLIRESGSTRGKAEIEWEATWAKVVQR